MNRPEVEKISKALADQTRLRIFEAISQTKNVTCGEGASTYVLLDDRDLVVIHRDRDVAGIERLSRL